MNALLLTRDGRPAPTTIKTDGRGQSYCEIDLACSMCGGTGRTRWKSDPICVACDGEGTSQRTERIRLYSPAELARLNGQLAAKRERHAEDHRNRTDALTLAHGDLLDAAEAIQGENPSVARILATVRRTGRLSDAQKASIEQAIADHAKGGLTFHVGTIGAVIEMTAQVTRVAKMTPRPGGRRWRKPGYALTLMGAQGEQLIAFVQAPYADGETLEITAKVKEHRIWRGHRQTVLTGLEARRGAA